MCPICNLSGRKNLSKIRYDLSAALSCIHVNRLDPDAQSLLNEFRSSAALLFSDMSSHPSEFIAIHVRNLTKLIAELKTIACNGVTDVGLSTIAATRLSNSLIDFEQEMRHLVETPQRSTAPGFTCKEEAI